MLLWSNFQHLQGRKFLSASLVPVPGLNCLQEGEFFPICPLLQLVSVPKKEPEGSLSPPT